MGTTWAAGSIATNQKAVFSADGIHSTCQALCHDPSNVGSLLFVLKLCFIEILFGVSLLVTSSLSCLRAKIRETLVEPGFLSVYCWLHRQWWCPNLANLPQLLISFPLASTRSRAGYCSTLGLLSPAFFEQGFSLFFYAVKFKGVQSLGLYFRMISFGDKTSFSLRLSLRLSWQRPEIMWCGSQRNSS